MSEHSGRTAARPAEEATSLQRTYRYLRLGIAGTVVIVVVAVAIAARDVGLLASISAYYYTPAQNMIVGALVAGALGLFALSGRGLENTLLDVAAVIAPLIAIIPTPFAPGRTDGLPYVCDGAVPCTPASVLPDIDNGTATYLIAGGAALVAAIIVDVARRREASTLTTWPTLAAAAVVLVTVWATWTFAREAYLARGHDVASIAFFLLLSAVALLNALRAGTADDPPPSRALRIAYAVIAAVIVIALVVIAVFLASDAAADAELPVVLVCELIALLAFGLFWLLQTIQKWRQPNPSLLAQ